MAYPIIVYFEKQPDWPILTSDLLRIADRQLEIFPIATKPGSSGDIALGISIPSKFSGNSKWNGVQSVLSYLLARGGCEIVELYGGLTITRDNLDKLKGLFLA